ncbi:MAG: ABC-2 family transporter protein [Mariniblastus sp.]|nr:ABC-2 family transporter protein [Mariniblastus sp.]
MSFRMNFVLQCFSSMSWAAMNWGLFKIIYRHTGEIGRGTGWHEDEFFIFLGTIWIINSLIQTFFMANAEEFSELIRTGNLDFALLKPIDTQFLISFPRINWAQVPNGLLGVALIIYSMINLHMDPNKDLYFAWFSIPAYLFFIGCGAIVMYSVMICLASTSIWFGRNQNLYNFWFYITNFYRYPMEIYQRGGNIGMALWCTFTFVIPILVVSNIPARILAQPLGTPWQSWEWQLAGFAIIASAWSLWASRWVFRKALLSYRSASS